MTNSELADQIPPLKPPRGEIPPGFWEQHGIWVIVAALIFVCLIAWGIWLLTRKRKRASLDPVVEARQALSNVSAQAEDGNTLSEISRIVRSYFLRAFDFPPGEHTTAEFITMTRDSTRTGPELARSLEVFLVECDRLKFAAIPPAGGPRAFDQANALIDSAERRREELRVAEREAARHQHARQS